MEGNHSNRTDRFFQMYARAYLRASTAEQDATRAREQVEAFAAERGLPIVGTYVENESGASLARPELFRLLADSKPGDLLIVEQVDRLSRLTDADWRKLRTTIDAKAVRIVALDLPTSWQLAAPADEFTGRMFAGAGGRRKASRRLRRKASTAAAPKIPIATQASWGCFAPACHGRRFKPRQAARAPRSPRLLGAPHNR
jgi:DNA invertase Pin-like site-specific DNA recombinase